MDSAPVSDMFNPENHTVMKRLSSILLAVLLVVLAGCGARKSQAYYDAKSKVLSANFDGTYVIRTQVRARNAAIGLFHDAMRKAMQEVIFDGVEAASSGVQPLKPLLFDMNARDKYEDYFNAFFQDKGEWTNYCSLQDKRTGSTRYNRTVAQSVDWVTVTINRAALKQKLIEDGILQ